MTSQDYNKAKVGDIVWWSDVNSRGRGLTKGVITKAGPKLITAVTVYDDGTQGRRSIVFRKDSGRTNDNYGHQCLIVNLEAYEDDRKARAAWDKIRQHYSKPTDATFADMQAVAQILKINIE